MQVQSAPYPDLSQSYAPVSKSNLLPVYQRSLNVGFSSSPPSDAEEDAHVQNDSDIGSRWSKEESRLTDELRMFKEHGNFSLGSGKLGLYHGDVILMLHEEWLMLLPAEEDAGSHSLSDWCTLQMHGRIHIDASVNVIVPNLQEQGILPLQLEVKLAVSLVIPNIYSNPGYSKQRTRELLDMQGRFLRLVYPISSPSHSASAIDIPFFYSILQPAPCVPIVCQSALQPRQLTSTLLPFQKRTVAWLLNREGMMISDNGEVIKMSPSTTFSLWTEIVSPDRTCFFHRVTGEVVPVRALEEPVRGAILAEEPGLGKTVEIISLVLLNPAPESRNPTITAWDANIELQVKTVKTTLIVTPPTLLQQWVDEIKTHAPNLKVLVYDGWSKVEVPIIDIQAERSRVDALKTKKTRGSRGKGKELPGAKLALEWCAYAHSFDIIITTYPVVRNELDVARAAPKRPRREDVVYTNVERPRSPLIMLEWHRIVMDEVQMGGGGKLEDMVSLIPRVSSIAVSGTPARNDVVDLLHVLRFLRVDAITNGVWNRLLDATQNFMPEFRELFQHYSIRTQKINVQSELTIPQQKRYLVSIDMGRVERHVYDQALDAVLLDLGLDARGVAASENWEVDGALLRHSIRHLRGIATHPQVGSLTKQTDKYNKPGSLKSMEEVLQSMKEQNWRSLMDQFKAKAQVLVHRAQLKQKEEQDPNRHQTALDLLLRAERETRKLIDTIQTVIDEHDVQGDVLRKEVIEARKRRQSSTDPKGKQREASPGISSEWEDSERDDDLPRTQAGEEHSVKQRALKQRLRECMIVLHQVKFLQGDVYHILGLKEEDAAYENAEKTRKDLLKSTADEANKGMAQLDVHATNKGVTQTSLMIGVPFLENGGLRSSDEVDQLHEIIDQAINEQSKLLWIWRTRIHSLLTQKLTNDDDDSPDGEEYQRTLESQGEAETYLQAYQALLADRKASISHERTVLATHDTREKQLRKTKAAIKAVAEATEPESFDIQPEHEVLLKELSDKRKELLLALDRRSIKTILTSLTAAYTRILRDTDPEKAILKQSIASIRHLIMQQTQLFTTLEADLAMFRKTFNQRILYFRQLQEISDSVAMLDLDDTLEGSIQACEAEETEIDKKVQTAEARQRYLQNLTSSSDDTIDAQEDSCILCRCEFVRGFMTQCAHVFCEGCMKAWIHKKDGKSCPVCRVPINLETMQRFSLSTTTQEQPPRIVAGHIVPRSTRPISYNMIDPKLFQAIQQMECFGDFGNKIQTLVRHLLYLQSEDPGSKSIVFSAWADSLLILERALSVMNGLACLRIDQGNKVLSAANLKKFRDDPEFSILLLHGERENAGLNVTCASRVFLLESVVHHGFEIQAIARIDRMGQTKPTEVFCYYAEDIVERNILDLAARKGMSLYTIGNATGSLDVTSLTEDVNAKAVEGKTRKKDQKGDFITKVEDMLSILFPHLFEDVDYLIPQEDNDMGDDLDWGNQPGPSGHVQL